MTHTKFIEGLRDFVQKRPDTKYSKGNYRFCSYNKGKCTDGTQGCLFGQYVKSINPKQYQKYMDESGGGIGHLISEGMFGLDTQQPTNFVEWCDAVQQSQDRGNTWGEAILEADKFYPLGKT